jgi:4-hydroxy-tetrahydrodipicolinate synthase
MDSIFKGSAVAICTPFDAAGNFNGSEYEVLIDFQLGSGTAAIVSCGTTGESATLTPEEHIEVVRTAVGAVKKRAPVIAGAGGNDTANCIHTGRALLRAGADALMFVTPYYNKTNQAGLVAHYTAIADALDAPIILYNVPSRTGLNMLPETVAKLAELPNIAGIKEASGDIAQVANIAARCDIPIYSGDDAMVLPVMSLGGAGCISTIANIWPTAMNEVCEGSLEMQLHILPLVKLLFTDVNPMPVKYALELLGYNCGSCRLPLVNIGDKLRGDLYAEMKRVGLL